MTFHAADIAAALREKFPYLAQKKLHKLLYYCQGHHLAAVGSPLFAESISAWDMGPVVGALWKAEHENGLQAPTADLDEAALNTIGYVVSRYGKLTGRDLELLTHAEDPWNRADATRPASGSVRIEREWLAEYFGADDDDDHLVNDATITCWLAGAVERRSDDLHQDSYEDIAARRRSA